MSLAVLEPGALGPLQLRNRVLRTAAFEAMCPGGAPSDALLEHHVSMAQGGVAMTTVAYCAVSEGSRTYSTQLLMSDEIVPGLARLTDAVHAADARASLQLGHCGDFSSPAISGRAPKGPTARFVLYNLARCQAMTKADIDAVVCAFVRAARLARSAGFDAVELHAGHGYLLSQFLCPGINRRTDEYGGSLDNRVRLAVEVVRAVRAEVGDKVAVLVKTNLEDGFRGGLAIGEAVQVCQRLEAAGAHGLVLSGGFVSRAPFYMLRGDVPVWDMARNNPSLLRKLGLALFGKLMVRRTPFEELFFLERAIAVRAAVRLPLVLLGGIASASAMERARAAGFDFVALGRALIRDPNVVRRLEAGEDFVSDCDHCNRCVAEMDRGAVRCACLDT